MWEFYSARNCWWSLRQQLHTSHELGTKVITKSSEEDICLSRKLGLLLTKPVLA
ncbi:hypothetical protein NC651_004743 [Populus alba x Populus x berolinensis]|nr:hypothetical protein NC651_004743 [Populus alba x Populus x berolinensis]